MSKLLIVTDSFTPDFSPRMSFLAKNLVSAGHSVTVLTEDIENPFFKIDLDGVDVQRLAFYKTRKESILRLAEWAVKSLLNFIFDYKSFYFLKKWKVETSGYDAVLCSTFNYFPLKPSYKMARRIGVPFVADIRDLSEQFTNHQYQLHRIAFLNNIFEWSQRVRRNRYLKRADAIVTVSPWHKEFLRHFNNNVTLIYNGFDSMFSPKNVKSDTFDIVYTGKWLGTDMQNPHLLFDAVEDLIDSGALPLDKIRLVWYLSKGRRQMEETLAAYQHCSHISTFCGKVSYAEIPSILQRSSVVLVLSNKFTQKGPKGIITTKFFEALGCEKPVLNVTADGSYLTSVIAETSAGLSADNVLDVKLFILSKYAEWSGGGFTRQMVNTTAKEHFNRAFQAKQFEAVINLLKTSKN